MSKISYASKEVVVEVDIDKLLKLPTQARKKAHKILDKAGFDIEATMKSLAAVDTGAMKSSVYMSGASNGGSDYEQMRAEAQGKAGARGKNIQFVEEVKPDGDYERIIGPSVNYALWVELKGQPFVEPAVQAHRTSFLGAWRELIE